MSKSFTGLLYHANVWSYKVGVLVFDSKHGCLRAVHVSQMVDSRSTGIMYAVLFLSTVQNKGSRDLLKMKSVWSHFYEVIIAFMTYNCTPKKIAEA